MVSNFLLHNFCFVVLCVFLFTVPFIIITEVCKAIFLVKLQTKVTFFTSLKLTKKL